jgi:hypothetical protein
MGGGNELASTDSPSEPASHLIEAVRLFEDAVWYLESAATPEEIQVNVCAVLSYAHALLGGEYHEPLAAECQAWQQLHPDACGPEAFNAARDEVVRQAWQLDGYARSWLTDPLDAHSLRAQAWDCLGGLTYGVAGARGSIVA